MRGETDGPADQGQNNRECRNSALGKNNCLLVSDILTRSNGDGKLHWSTDASGRSVELVAKFGCPLYILTVLTILTLLTIPEI